MTTREGLYANPDTNLTNHAAPTRAWSETGRPTCIPAIEHTYVTPWVALFAEGAGWVSAAMIRTPKSFPRVYFILIEKAAILSD